MFTALYFKSLGFYSKCLLCVSVFIQFNVICNKVKHVQTEKQVILC